jgi:hypothetical protein
MLSGIISPDSISFTGTDGSSHFIPSGDDRYAPAKELWAAYRQADSDEDREHIHERLTALVTEGLRNLISRTSSIDSVRIEHGVVFWNDTEIHNAITERILWCCDEDVDPEPYILFLDRIMLNPSYRAVECLFRFVDANRMAITPDGCILAYKRVRNDYRDIHSGSFNNSPGENVFVRRNQVDENPDKTCSHGLHVCAYSYLPHFGVGSGNRVVIVKVDPADVVAVPHDYNNAKMRVCAYDVIDELQRDKVEDILGKPVEEFETSESIEDWRKAVQNGETRGYREWYEEEVGDSDDDDDGYEEDGYEEDDDDFWSA